MSKIDFEEIKNTEECKSNTNIYHFDILKFNNVLDTTQLEIYKSLEEIVIENSKI